MTPYPNLDQIVSGTLSYAMGAGKAIVSTPYAYARERLAGGRGRLVAPGSPDALADAIVELLGNREVREAIGRRAYDLQPRHALAAGGRDVRRDLRGGRSVGPARTPATGSPNAARSLRWLTSRSTRSAARTWPPLTGTARDLAARGRAGPGPRVRLLHRRRRTGAARRPAPRPELGWGAVEDSAWRLAAVPGRRVRPGGTALPELPRRGQGLVPERSLRGQPGPRAADAGHRAGAGRRSAPRRPGA